MIKGESHEDVVATGAEARSTEAAPASFVALTLPVVRCPHCRHRFTVDEAAPFDEIRCSSCGELFHLLRDAAGDIPRRVGHFELLKPLGMGSFGAVFHAHDTKLDRSVAVKIPRHQDIEESEIEEIMHEARVAAQLRHPNIVSVHEVGRDGKYVYIVSDLIDGLPLNRWLEEQPATMRQQVEICRRLALALDYAHESGIVHRDLKPANILVDRTDDPHLTDFGLAKQAVDDVTMTLDGRILGTPAYMSPEQAKGNADDCDRRSDVYSMGVILFEVLTGDLPFRGNMRALAQKVIHEEPPSPRQLNSHLSIDLETICLKCLQKEPRQRYATARLLADDLQNWLDGLPVKARPIGPFERFWRWSLRHPTESGFAAALVLTLTLIFIASASIVRSSTQGIAEILKPVQGATEVLLRNQLNPVVAQAAQELAAQPELLRSDGQQPLLSFLESKYDASAEDQMLKMKGISVESWFVLNDKGMLMAIWPKADHVTGRFFQERDYFRQVIDGPQEGPYIGDVYRSRNNKKFKLPVSILITTAQAGEPQKNVLVASVSAPGTKVQDLISQMRSQFYIWAPIVAIPMSVFLLALSLKAAVGFRR